MWVKEEHNGRINRNLSIDPFLHKILSFPNGSKPTWYTLFIFGSYLEIKMILRLGQMFFYIIAYSKKMINSSYGPELWPQARPH